MGFGDNFKRNVGGWSGALSAAGEMFSEMAVVQGQGGNLGTALGAGTKALGAGFEKGKEKYEGEEFRLYARKMAEESPEGSKERQYWEAVASGNMASVQLLPSLWKAQSLDAESGRGTPAQRAKDRQTLQARQNLINHPELIEKMKLENDITEWTRATRPLVTSPDPEYERFSSWAALGILARDRGSYDDWGPRGYDKQGDMRFGPNPPPPPEPGDDPPDDEIEDDRTWTEWVKDKAQDAAAAVGIGEGSGYEPGVVLSPEDELKAEAAALLDHDVAVATEGDPVAQVDDVVPPLEQPGLQTGKVEIESQMVGYPSTGRYGNLRGLYNLEQGVRKSVRSRLEKLRPKDSHSIEVRRREETRRLNEQRALDAKNSSALILSDPELEEERRAAISMRQHGHGLYPGNY